MALGQPGEMTGQIKGQNQGAPPIVVGLDGSESAAAALRWAADRAARSRQPVHVLHVYDAGPARRIRSRAMRQAIESHARARATEWINGALHDANGSKISLEVAEGNPNRVLPWMSRRADVLVLGAPRDNRVRRILGSSVARTCSWRASCPVVLVPAVPGPPAADSAGASSLPGDRS